MKANKREKFASEKKQYIETMVGTLLALWLIISFTFLSFYNIARNDAVAIGESAVTRHSEELNNFLLKGLDVLEVTKTNIDYMVEKGEDPEGILDYLLKQSESYTNEMDENFTSIYGVFNGVYLDGSGWKPEEGFDPKSRPWYKAAVEGNGEPVVVSPYVDARTGRIMISVSQLLADGESVVSLDIAMDEMQEFAENINLNGKGYGFIIDAKGLVIAHSDLKEKGKNYLTDESVQGTQMQEIVKKVIDGNGKTINIRINGDDSRVFSQVVQDRWYVVMIMNVHDLFDEVETNLVICIVLSLLIYGAVAYFITNSHKNRRKAMLYAEKVKEYQGTLEKRVEEQTEEIKSQAEKMVELQKNAVEAMATLIEGRDGNTGEHVQNTKKYVSMIVQYMYDNKIQEDIVTQNYVKNVSDAATLHDIGKIKISDIILNKPGKFTPEEYEEMKKHASYGGDIVKDILGKNADEMLLTIAEDIARYHHEKWDGSGYPQGLKAKEIPLSARIMAVADVFDALVSKRVYKDAMSVDKAMEILKKDSGSHFDPEIVDIFIKIRPGVEAHLKEISS